MPRKEHRAPHGAQCRNCKEWEKTALDWGRCSHSKMAYAYRTCDWFERKKR